MSVGVSDCCPTVAVRPERPLPGPPSGNGPAPPKAGGDETLPPSPGRPPLLDRFHLLSQLGSGAFGMVWKAHDTDLDRIVAIKVPRQECLDAGQVRRFLEEARACGRLKHPNIVSVYEARRHRQGVYIVAEFVSGQTLAERLEQGRPTAREAAELCRTIAEAMHYAHEAGVIHRDLKPSNILVDDHGVPHVADFGLAKLAADEATMTAEGQVLGTPGYMSPEQVQGDSRRVDRRTDVYALGVILFELLTGERPFRGTVQRMIHQVIEAEAPRPRSLHGGVPRDLETICVKCLEKEPRRRYPSAKALADDLGRFLDGRPVKARPVRTCVRLWRWCRRNRLVAGLAWAVFLVLSAGLVAAGSQWVRAERAAAREAQIRGEIETLTEKLLDLAERLQKLEQRGAPSSLGRGSRAELREDASLRLAFSLQREPPQPTGLQTEARATLRRLEQLSPGVARRCRSAFPQLAGGD
ncbi:MAG: serine/threonine protein kinase [Pirellulales bacterium]|nr:serine/threonine protein kinase [Pirellulales bacterium]